MAMKPFLICHQNFGILNRGSFVQTSEGFLRGLIANKAPALVWTPEEDEEGEVPPPPVAQAQAVILFGPPLYASWVNMVVHGAAQLGVPVYWMLAANSRTLPPSVRSWLRAFPTVHLLTPSEWSARVIRSVLRGCPETDPLGRRVLVVPHGVEIDAPLATNDSRWCHLVAGVTGRKGTEELVEAVEEDIPLCIYTDATAHAWVRDLVEAQPNIEVRRAYNANILPDWWMHEKYVQPSRAEGFGICAAEAMLLGRTVLLRVGTGEPDDELGPFAFRLRTQDDWPLWEGGDGPLVHSPEVPPLRVVPPKVLRAAMLDVAADHEACYSPNGLRKVSIWNHREAIALFLQAHRCSA